MAAGDLTGQLPPNFALLPGGGVQSKFVSFEQPMQPGEHLAVITGFPAETTVVVASMTEKGENGKPKIGAAMVDTLSVQFFVDHCQIRYNWRFDAPRPAGAMVVVG
jgi:hypothetical protein